MKLHPLSLALAEAPVDPFVPDGAQRFKVVVRSRTHGVVEVTGGHDSAEEALDEFAGVCRRLDTHGRMHLHRTVHAMELHRKVEVLEQRMSSLREMVEKVHGVLTKGRRRDR